MFAVPRCSRVNDAGKADRRTSGGGLGHGSHSKMSASSQQTSAAAGEIVTSAEQLRQTAEELQRLVSEFKLTA